MLCFERKKILTFEKFLHIVGKSALVRRYSHGTFSQSYKSTVGVDFALKVLKWKDGISIRLQLWDIAGQERFGQMTRVYYKDAVGALLLYDVTQPATFQSVKRWKNDVDNKVLLDDGRPIPCVLIGNKVDLLNSGRLPSKDEQFLSEYTAENQFLSWFTTSAKTGHGIEEAMEHLVTKIIENKQTVQANNSNNSNHKKNNHDTITLGSPKSSATVGGNNRQPQQQATIHRSSSMSPRSPSSLSRTPTKNAHQYNSSSCCS